MNELTLIRIILNFLRIEIRFQISNRRFMKEPRRKIHLRIKSHNRNKHHNNLGTLVLTIGISKVNNNKTKIPNLEHLQILIFHNNHNLNINHNHKYNNKI